MFINISSCMLVWLHLAYPIALSCLDLGLHFCIGRSEKRSTEALYEQRPLSTIQTWSILIGRCWGAVQSALRTAPLCFPVRTEQGHCTGAVQKRPTYSAQGKIVVSLIKTTTLHLGTLYICHFDFRSITRVHIQISYLGYFSKRRKIPRTHF